MIIDFHRHMWSALERHPSEFTYLPKDEQSSAADFDWETRARGITQEMAAARVDASVILVADFGARLGEAAVSIYEENDMLLRAAEAHGPKLIPFFGIDPRRPNAPEATEEAIKRGARGVKLHPAVGFYPHDTACYPIYELCAANDVPVLFHVGPGFHPKLYSRFTHPLEYDQVAADFPSLPMVMGHAGGDWWEDCLVVARAHPNMILELSEWQLLLRDRPEETAQVLAAMVQAVGAGRIVWGSDFPHVRRYMSLADSVGVFSRLSEMPTQTSGRPLSSVEVEALLGGTARQLLAI